jgi:O-antigen/teichoic acid export membrane protein
MKRGLKNLFSVTLGELIGPFLGFFIIAYLARILGVKYFGMINFAQAIFSYGLILNYLGLPTLGTREVARNKQVESTVSSILGLRLFLSFIGFILILIITLFLPKDSEAKTLIILYGFTLFAIGLVLEWFYQGKEAMEYLAYSKIINSGVYFLLIIIFVRGKQDIYFVPIAFFLSNLSNTFFLLFIYTKRFGKLRLGFNWKQWKGLLRFALPLGVASIFIQFGQYFTPSLLGFIKGNVAVGYFSAAYKLVSLIAMVDRVFTIIALPMITRYYSSNDSERLKVLLSHLQKLLITVILPIIAGGIILAKEVVAFVYGINYYASASIFQILIFFFGITIFVSLFGVSLIASGKESAYARSIGAGTLTNVVLNPFLTFFFGAIGSAISVVMAEGVTLTFASSNYRKFNKIKILQHIPKPLLATCLMVVFLLLCSNVNLFLKIIGGVLIYVGFLFLIKGISIRDLELRAQ